MLLNLRLITPPVVEPVSLEQAKAHLVIGDLDFLDDDNLIQGYITGARQYSETYSGRAFFNQTWLMSLDSFPLFSGHNGTLNSGEQSRYALYSYFYDGITIFLPKPRCVSVLSIKYVDLAGVTQTLDPSSYYVDTSSEPARIIPQPGTYWPYTKNYLPGSIEIRFVAGSYGDGVTVNTCPYTVNTAILLLVAYWYSNREASSQATLTEIPMGVCALLDTEKFQRFSWGC